MTETRQPLATQTRTYLNPVYERDCPDPFVLKYAGEYWAYCTGFWRDGRAFGILHSRDLVGWRELAGAMEPLPGNHTCYWAPEVVYDGGRFLMYYSVGNEARMAIRVAIAEHPAGPFVDAGKSLTKEEFAIDAHVFVDDDGARHLFYATDFLTHTHIGTGIVRDRMLDALTLAGAPVPVTRARYDWQVYDPARREKGGVRWHTVEGPTVLKHKGRYYEMFSGGNWQNTTYGVSFASAARIDQPEEWEQHCDGVRVLPILRTLPGKVTGPGHNSVVRGPDNRQLFCIYHRWAEEGRVLAIDRLDWAGQRMLVLGPSTTPQPAPIAPTYADHFDDQSDAALGEHWRCEGGHWAVRDGAAVQPQATSETQAEAQTPPLSPSFVVEVMLRAESGDGAPGGTFGLRLRAADGSPALDVLLEPETRQLSIALKQAHPSTFAVSGDLAPGFDFSAFHLLRLEIDEGQVSIGLDDAAFRWRGRVAAPAPARVALVTRQAAAAFKGFALTVGWEDLFMDEEPGRGWQASGTDGKWYLNDRQLCYAPAAADAPGVIWKGPLLEDYEMVVNARLARDVPAENGYGFLPATVGVSDGSHPLLTLLRTEPGWALQLRDGSTGGGGAAASARTFPLPDRFDPFEYQQFRFIKQGGVLSVQWEGELLGAVAAPPGATSVGLWAQGAGAAFDLVRVTVLNSGWPTARELGGGASSSINRR